jgi:hypothetical protein
MARSLPRHVCHLLEELAEVDLFDAKSRHDMALLHVTKFRCHGHSAEPPVHFASFWRLDHVPGVHLHPRAIAFALIGALLLACVAQGCKSPTDALMAPSGGHVLKLSYSLFASQVEPVLVRQGCDATGDCHGGGIRGTLQLSPPTAKDPMYDYNQCILEVYPMARDSSLLLTKPLALAAGGVPHSYKPFASTADTDYVKIRGWIDAGVLQ